MTAVCALFYSIYVEHKDVCRFLCFSWLVFRTLCWVCFQAVLLVAVSVIILLVSGCCLKKWQERVPVAVAAPETHEHALRARVHSGKHQPEEFKITIIPEALVESFERWRDNTPERKKWEERTNEKAQYDARKGSADALKTKLDAELVKEGLQESTDVTEPVKVKIAGTAASLELFSEAKPQKTKKTTAWTAQRTAWTEREKNRPLLRSAFNKWKKLKLDKNLFRS